MCTPLQALNLSHRCCFRLKPGLLNLTPWLFGLKSTAYQSKSFLPSNKCSLSGNGKHIWDVKCSALITFNWNGMETENLNDLFALTLQVTPSALVATALPSSGEKQAKSQWQKVCWWLVKKIKKNGTFSDLFAQRARNEKLRKQRNYFPGGRHH